LFACKINCVNPMHVGYQIDVVNVYSQQELLGWPSICHMFHAK
jgi:hypothetical protein